LAPENPPNCSLFALNILFMYPVGCGAATVCDLGAI
jgi:hypothetical protein